jgi:hypothetical protein
MSEPYGSDASFGSDGQAESGSIGAGADQSAGGTSGATNGAWNELLGAIPREFHPVITPHLQKWESNYGQLAQQYAPWKKAFADKGSTPEELSQAQQLYTLVNQNPQLVYERLAQHLQELRASQPGYQEPQVDYNQQPQYQEMGQEPGYGYAGEQQDGQDTFQDPRLAQMYQQVQQMNEYLQYQSAQMQQQQAVAEQEQLTSSYEQQMDTGIRQILARDPQADVNDLLQRALVQVAQGADPDLERAYAEQQQFVQRIRSMPMNSANAPRVMPTGGGLPPTIDNSRPRSNAEKADRVRQLLEAAQQT